MFVVQNLVLEEARIHVYDPHVLHRDIWVEKKCMCNMSMDMHPNLGEATTMALDPYAACEGAHALSVDEFKGLDNPIIYTSMAKPVFIFDKHTILDHDGL